MSIVSSTSEMRDPEPRDITEVHTDRKGQGET